MTSNSKTCLRLIALALLPLSSAHWIAAQQSAGSPPPDKDPFVGIWKANKDASRPKLSDKDAQSVWVRSRGGAEIVTRKEGTPTSDRLLCDGDRHPFGPPVQVAPPMSSLNVGSHHAGGMGPVTEPTKSFIVCRYITPYRIEIEIGSDLHKEGQPFFVGTIAYWTQEVSTDGQQRTDTEYKDKARTKVERTFVFDRTKGP